MPKPDKKPTIAKLTAANDGGEKPKISGKLLLDFYREMLMIRRFEEKAGQLYGMGLIGGFCHLYIGQEAVVVGLEHSRHPGDSVIASYRDHGHMLACGMEPRGIMAELTGRAAGYSKGKGGSMHMFSYEKRFFGGHGIVGAQVGLGTGLAFAHKYKEDGNICYAYYGDGAANQGAVYEAFNLAALWKLPIIFVVENNEYAMGTSVKRGTASTEFYKRGAPWGIPGWQVDGMNVETVYEAGVKAAAHCRAGNGPVLLEMKTYRYRGHSMSDPAKYRTKEEVEKYREQKDPIQNLQSKIIGERYATEDTLKLIEKEIKEIVNDAAQFSQETPEPDAGELYTDVTVE